MNPEVISLLKEKITYSKYFEGFEINVNQKGDWV